MKIANNEWERKITDYYFELGYFLGVMATCLSGIIVAIFYI